MVSSMVTSMVSGTLRGRLSALGGQLVEKPYYLVVNVVLNDAGEFSV